MENLLVAIAAVSPLSTEDRRFLRIILYRK